MNQQKNVYGMPLQPCSFSPQTGYIRDGYCTCISSDIGQHTICVVVTEDFLTFSKSVGTYYIKQNRPGLGDHICSCGYMVDPKYQGQGIGTAMCEHSQTEAKALGFTGMQFNFVVSSNTAAVKLWQYLGFNIIGEIPNAYRFNANPETKKSVYIMYKAI